MIRKVLIGALMIVAVFAAPAAAQYDTFTVSPGGVESGGTTTFQGDGCEPGSTVTISIDGDTLATVVANDQGQFTGSIVVDLPAGDYTVTATCGDVVQTAPLNVRGVSDSTTTAPDPTAPAPAPGPGVGGQGGGSPLPRTGSNTTSLVLVGALLLAGGGAMVVARKRFA